MEEDTEYIVVDSDDSGFENPDAEGMGIEQPMFADETSASTAIEKLTTVADQQFEYGFNKLKSIGDAIGVNEVLNEVGLVGVYESINVNRAKTLLSAYALLKIFNSLKTNFMKVGLVGGLVFLVVKNKESLRSILPMKNIQNQIPEIAESSSLSGLLNYDI